MLHQGMWSGAPGTAFTLKTYCSWIVTPSTMCSRCWMRGPKTARWNKLSPLTLIPLFACKKRKEKKNQTSALVCQHVRELIGFPWYIVGFIVGIFKTSACYTCAYEFRSQMNPISYTHTLMPVHICHTYVYPCPWLFAPHDPSLCPREETQEEEENGFSFSFSFKIILLCPIAHVISSP